jgi:ATP-dependent DNA helicase RecG
MRIRRVKQLKTLALSLDSKHDGNGMGSGSQTTTAVDQVLPLLAVDEIYRRASVELLLSLGKEDRRFERKRSGTENQTLAEYFSMWANTAPDGGIIVIGMEDDCSISGCQNRSTDEMNRLESVRIQFCPDSRSESKRIAAINSRTGRKDYLLIIRVLYRPDKVVRTTSGNAYWRIADKRKRLSEEEIRELQIDKGEIDFELEPCGLEYPGDFNQQIIKDFAGRFSVARGLRTRNTKEEILVLALLGKKRAGKSAFVPNMACALLFANDPRLRFPGCFIRFLRFDGETEGSGEKFNAVKDIHLYGNIPSLISSTEQVLDDQLRDFSRLGKDGKFFTAPEYPKPAWYEAIVNACVHRAYSLRTMNVFVKMFDDRLEVESPGGFPPLVTPHNIYDVHKPRNPYLMDALRHFDYVKCAHEGTRRIRDTMTEVNLPAPEFRQVESSTTPLVRVVLRNNVRQRRVWLDSAIGSIVGEAVMQGLNDDEKRLVNFAAEFGELSVSDAQRLMQKSWSASKKVLQSLVVKKILDYHSRSDAARDPKARFYISRHRLKPARNAGSQ